MEIKEIIRITELVKKVNCQNYALISEVAKEMGVKKTMLMQFIVDNPGLFKLVEQKKGLAMKEVYTDAALNPETDEWVEVQKKVWEKKIHVFEMTYYDCHEFYFVDVDRDYDKRRYHLWRNTAEKVKELEDAGLIKKTTTCYGGFGDCRKWEGYIVNEGIIEKIRDAGWEVEMPEK